MTALLEDKGTPAECVDLSAIIAEDLPQVLTQNSYQKLAQVLGRRIHRCGPREFQ